MYPFSCFPFLIQFLLYIILMNCIKATLTECYFFARICMSAGSTFDLQAALAIVFDDFTFGRDGSCSTSASSKRFSWLGMSSPLLSLEKPKNLLSTRIPSLPGFGSSQAGSVTTGAGHPENCGQYHPDVSKSQ